MYFDIKHDKGENIKEFVPETETDEPNAPGLDQTTSLSCKMQTEPLFHPPNLYSPFKREYAKEAHENNQMY